MGQVLCEYVVRVKIEGAPVGAARTDMNPTGWVVWADPDLSDADAEDQIVALVAASLLQREVPACYAHHAATGCRIALRVCAVFGIAVPVLAA